MRAARIRLPAALGPSSFARIAAVLTPQPVIGSAPTPFASEDTIWVARPAELDVAFRRVAAGTYQHRQAHSIWELRAAEDGDGYVLVRKREERLTDLRTASQGLMTVNFTIPVDADAILGMLHDPADDDRHTAPLERDPFEATTSDVERELEDLEAHAASFVRQAQLARLIVEAVRIDDAIDRWVTAERSFLPELMGGAFAVRGMDWPGSHYRKLRIPSDGPTFYIEGWHLPGGTDTLYGVPHAMLPYPSARHQDQNMRIRAFPAGGGRPVFLTLRELDVLFRLGRNQSIPLPPDMGAVVEEMPGEALPPGPVDATGTTGTTGTTDETLLYPTETRTMARRSLWKSSHGHPHCSGRAPAAAPGGLLRDLADAIWTYHDRHDAPPADRSRSSVPRRRSAPDSGIDRSGRAPGNALRPRCHDGPRIP